MSEFLDRHERVEAASLRGPRVYSTDLLPNLYDPERRAENVEITARALKIKLITKGLVTLNCVHLLSPLAMDLLDAHPDLFEGGGILPAFRTDKGSLADLVPSLGNTVLQMIDRNRLDDHLARLEGSLKRVMPWDLKDVGERYRSLLTSGLHRPDTLIVRQLKEAAGLSSEAIAEIEAAVSRLPLSDSVSLQTYFASLPESARQPLELFSGACYHMVGTSVVNCETGTDLNPLSAFKATDLQLAARDADAAMLSDQAVFLDVFMGYALNAVGTVVVGGQIIDAMTFGDAHALGSALHKQGFQEKYDGIVKTYLHQSGLSRDQDILDALDAEAVAAVAVDLAQAFEEAIGSELDKYQTRSQEEAKAEVYRAGSDVGRDLIGLVPGVSNLVSFADAISHSTKMASAVGERRSVSDHKSALAHAAAKRQEEINSAIAKLSADKKKKDSFLAAVATLSDIHTARTRRA